jgi:hypothetical protein
MVKLEENILDWTVLCRLTEIVTSYAADIIQASYVHVSNLQLCKL